MIISHELSLLDPRFVTLARMSVELNRLGFHGTRGLAAQLKSTKNKQDTVFISGLDSLFGMMGWILGE
jgi:hypothetical protein